MPELISVPQPPPSSDPANLGVEVPLDIGRARMPTVRDCPPAPSAAAKPRPSCCQRRTPHPQALLTRLPARLLPARLLPAPAQIWDRYPEDIAKQLSAFCELFNVNIQTFCWAPAARRFMLHTHSADGMTSAGATAEVDPVTRAARDSQTRGYLYLHFRLPSKDERSDRGGTNVLGCYFQPLHAWQPPPAHPTHGAFLCSCCALFVLWCTVSYSVMLFLC